MDLIPKYKDDTNLGRPPARDDVNNYPIKRGKLINNLRKARIDLAQTIEKIEISEQLINFGGPTVPSVWCGSMSTDNSYWKKRKRSKIGDKSNGQNDGRKWY